MDTTEQVKADPKRPYKAIAAFFLTLLGTFWAALEGRDNLENMSGMEWLSIIVPVLLTTGTVYGLKNPKVLTTNHRIDNQRGVVTGNTVWMVLGIVGIVVIVWLVLTSLEGR